MTVDSDVDRGSVTDHLVTRREVVTAIGGATVASTIGTGGVSGTTASEEPFSIRIYPGPVPLRAWVRYGFDGMHRNWPPPFGDVLAAVEDALEQVLSYAHDQSRLTDVEIRVERGAQVQYPLSAARLSTEAVLPSRETTLAVFRDQIRDRDVGSPTACHLLLAWAPFNYRLGYGGTHPEIARIGHRPEEGAYTAANVGATELWDSRAVTRNIAIHEVLHTLISPEVAEAVGGSRCDHDLGTAVRTDDETLQVSPIATAYAGPDRRGGGTRWHGTGCYDHDEFYRHDAYEGVDRFTYTTQLSEATLEAVTRYLEEQRRAS